MSDWESLIRSGMRAIFTSTYETRRIIIGQGIEAHDADVENYTNDSIFNYLSRKLGADFHESSDTEGEYTSHDQRVHYELKTLTSKVEFKTALETANLHVIYDGHSRYGRGGCFDVYSGLANGHGDQWGDGTNNSNGLFRLGYEVVPVEIDDIEHHHYHFAPFAVEDGVPPRASRHPFSRHPHARRRLSRILLPADLRGYVKSGYQSPSNNYYGYQSRGKTHLLLYAGWESTSTAPYDLGSVNLNCRTFCHFGCSSRLHYWNIVRRSEYKNWQRDRPPTSRFAYFTTAPSDYQVSNYWLYYLLKYPSQNNYQSWWNSLEWAKRRANRKLRAVRAGFQIY